MLDAHPLEISIDETVNKLTPVISLQNMRVLSSRPNIHTKTRCTCSLVLPVIGSTSTNLLYTSIIVNSLIVLQPDAFSSSCVWASKKDKSVYRWWPGATTVSGLYGVWSSFTFGRCRITLFEHTSQRRTKASTSRAMWYHATLISFLGVKDYATSAMRGCRYIPSVPQAYEDGIPNIHGLHKILARS